MKKILHTYGFTTAFLCGVILIILLTACEELVEIDPPRTELVNESVFSSDGNTISAISGIYTIMLENRLNLFHRGLEVFTGTAADELDNYSTDINYVQFSNNELVADNNALFIGLWQIPFEVINNTNLIIEGLRDNTLITPEVRNQVLGEALFVRAFAYFYLTNLFGAVPYVENTMVEANSTLSRKSSLEIYNRVIEDLLEAQPLMMEDYSFVADEERVRPTRMAATALLARVYLYQEDWANAETQANELLNQSDQFVLADSLDDVFLANSSETIWQLKPLFLSERTDIGNLFILPFAPPNNFRPNAVSQRLLNAFEPNDKRRTVWIGEVSNSSATFYYPWKYKTGFRVTAKGPEYVMVLRLTEQYLIRAESRAQQNDLTGAIADLDLIRKRAGLPLIRNTNPSISQVDLLFAIEQERRVELFAEYGHRWLDLKRTDRADEVLTPLKTGWQPTDVLFPIPEQEILNNPNLLPQNQGY